MRRFKLLVLGIQKHFVNDKYYINGGHIHEANVLSYFEGLT